jgi:glycosyltransferase involved in cell wall biosynthesis
MATGFPEGLALPPLEAMACGCLVAGFAGLGAWDYLRQAQPGGYLPLCPLPALPWEKNKGNASDGNAFIAADNDALGLCLGLEAAAKIVLNNPESCRALREHGLAAAAFYSADNQRKAIAQLWQTWDA